MVEYRVESVRESLIGGKFKPEALEQLLNQRSREGWDLRHIFEADIKGRIGPGSVSGLIIVFERGRTTPPVQPAVPPGPISGPGMD